MNEPAEITLKELLERLVALETKFDLAMQRNNRTTKRFSFYVGILVLLEITNIILSIIVYLK